MATLSFGLQFAWHAIGMATFHQHGHACRLRFSSHAIGDALVFISFKCLPSAHLR